VVEKNLFWQKLKMPKILGKMVKKDSLLIDNNKKA